MEVGNLPPSQFGGAFCNRICERQFVHSFGVSRWRGPQCEAFPLSPIHRPIARVDFQALLRRLASANRRMVRKEGVQLLYNPWCQDGRANPAY